MATPIKFWWVKVMLENPTPTIEKKWLQNNIFCSTFRVNGQVCTVVIDNRSSNNRINRSCGSSTSKGAQKSSTLLCSMIDDGRYVQVRHRCQVTIPSVMTTSTKLGAMLCRWMLMISYLEDYGCMTWMEFTKWERIHIDSLKMEKSLHSTLWSRDHHRKDRDQELLRNLFK